MLCYNDEMQKRLMIVALLLLIPLVVFAAPSPPGCIGDGAGGTQVCVGTGVSSTIPSILQGFVNVLFGWAALVATALFMLGSILMVGSGGEEKYLSAGKAIMKSSMIGFAIVLSSWLILSTVIYFIVS